MNRLPCHVLVLASLVAVTPQAAAPQEGISRGVVVRVAVPSAGLVDHRGRLEDVTSDSIRVGARRFARSEITKIEVAHDASNFLRFSGIGLATGVALGATACLIECPSNDSDVSKGGFMLLYSGVAGGAGLALGAVVGGLTHRTKWVAVPERSLQPTLAPSSDGRLLLGVRIRM